MNDSIPPLRCMLPILTILIKKGILAWCWFTRRSRLHRKRSKVHNRIRVQCYFLLVASLTLCPLTMNNMVSEWTCATPKLNSLMSVMPRKYACRNIIFFLNDIKCWEIVLYSQSSSFLVFFRPVYLFATLYFLWGRILLQIPSAAVKMEMPLEAF